MLPEKKLIKIYKDLRPSAKASDKDWSDWLDLVDAAANERLQWHPNFNHAKFKKACHAGAGK